MNTSPLSTGLLGRKLRFNHLMVFELVLETGSFIKAANVMGLTQPAVTKTIYDLEFFVGAPLFERSNRGATPTDLGIMLGRRAKSLIAEMRYMSEEVNAFKTGEAGHVVVGTLTSASTKLLPCTIAKILSATPGVAITIREGDAEHLFPALATGDLDIVIGRLPELGQRQQNAFPLTHTTLFKEDFCMAVGRHHPLAMRKNLKMDDLATEKWIVPLPGSLSYEAIENFFRKIPLGFPRQHVKSMSPLTDVGLLLETEMIALMPRAATLQFVDAGILAILDFSTETNFGDIGFSIRADKTVNPACSNFIHYLREAAKEILV